nr:retrovirus-related Pol polyprotein from transposon TNT 1-94 [Tanacetum cinerariifolium]GEX98057.1 retrovirus-related Pol polyprotein from transposon TNT 1-94 [Tanacetum cinerariifolium]
SNPSMNIQSTSSTHINVHAEENNNDQADKGEQLQDDEFTNPLCASTQEEAESSSHNFGNSNVSTFNQPQVSEYRWTKDHPLEQVRGNPSRPVWELVDKQFGKMVIRLKWLWKNKKDVDQTVIRNKARLVAKGTQVFSNLLDGRENDISQWSTEGGDADHGGCIDSRKSTSGGIQFLGDKLVSWMSKKQNYTAMYSAEAEYVTLSGSSAQVMWMRTQLQDYGFNYNKISLYSDSQTEYQLADMFTKALPKDRFKYLVRRIGMRCLTPAELEVLAKESA